jgi:hypothetical protein
MIAVLLDTFEKHHKAESLLKENKKKSSQKIAIQFKIKKRLFRLQNVRLTSGPKLYYP